MEQFKWKVEQYRDTFAQEYSAIFPAQQAQVVAKHRTRHRTSVSSHRSENGETEIVRKVPCRALFAGE